MATVQTIDLRRLALGQDRPAAAINWTIGAWASVPAVRLAIAIS